jgi:hypothetical protein
VDDRPSRNFICVRSSISFLILIDGRRLKSSIADAYDHRVLDLTLDNGVRVFWLDSLAGPTSDLCIR